jgi:hypothetical protein
VCELPVAIYFAVGLIDFAEMFLRDFTKAWIRLEAVGVPDADEVEVSLANLFRCGIGGKT